MVVDINVDGVFRVPMFGVRYFRTFVAYYTHYFRLRFGFENFERSFFYIFTQ